MWAWLNACQHLYPSMHWHTWATEQQVWPGELGLFRVLLHENSLLSSGALLQDKSLARHSYILGNWEHICVLLYKLIHPLPIIVTPLWFNWKAWWKVLAQYKTNCSLSLFHFLSVSSSKQDETITQIYLFIYLNYVLHDYLFILLILGMQFIHFQNSHYEHKLRIRIHVNWTILVYRTWRSQRSASVCL